MLMSQAQIRKQANLICKTLGTWRVKNNGLLEAFTRVEGQEKKLQKLIYVKAFLAAGGLGVSSENWDEAFL